MKPIEGVSLEELLREASESMVGDRRKATGEIIKQGKYPLTTGKIKSKI